ncbi:putative nucleic-acid-binding protein containing a Zn-ribbon [Mycobacteroides abscessus subsp. abscessus]|nr:putative nucleic-acid-binding protein containing a Zn-ribbon [Mycobacteroides abscessus subsp. abscessus]
MLGKVVTGTGAADLRVGQAMELALEPLYTDDEGVERLVYAWKKVSA